MDVMARRKIPTAETAAQPTGSTPMWPASVELKRWVRAALAKHEWSQRQVTAAIRERFPKQAISSAAFAQHFGGKDSDLKPTNISFMPALLAVLAALGEAFPGDFPIGIAADEIEMLQAELARRWPTMTARERELVKTLLKK